MSYLCNLFFIFIFIFIMINRISQEYIHTFSSDHFLEYILSFLDDNADEEYEQFSNSESSVSESCLAFA